MTIFMQDVHLAPHLFRVTMVLNGDVADITVQGFTPDAGGMALINGVRSKVDGTIKGTVHIPSGKMNGIVIGALNGHIAQAISQGALFFRATRPVKGKDGKDGKDGK